MSLHTHADSHPRPRALGALFVEVVAVAALLALCLPATFAIEPAGDGIAIGDPDWYGSQVVDPRRAVAMNGAGEFVVAWRCGNTYYKYVWVTRFAADGTQTGNDIRVARKSPWFGARYVGLSVAEADSGEFVVAYDDDYGGGGDQTLQSFAADGSFSAWLRPCSWSSYSPEYDVCPRSDTDITVDAQGRFLTTSTHDSVRRFDRTLQPLSGEIPLPDILSGGSIDAEPGGGFMVVWQAPDGSDDGVFGQRYDAADQPVGTPFQINQHTTADQVRPDVAVSDDGGFIVVWSSDGQDGSGWGVVGRRFAADDQPLGGEFLVSTETIGHQRYPAVAADPRGNFVVTWQQSDPADGYNLIARAFRADGRPDPETPAGLQVNQTGEGTNASVAMGDEGQVAVVWQSGAGEVYAQLLTASALTTSIFADGFESGDTSAWTGAWFW